ncbi:carbohydrate kinase family protein [Candidatus Bipolaricaulota bacterium]|nr:carbohydrate kinase family protein [Candidatus Bipolaricaulota bacterium]
MPNNVICFGNLVLDVLVRQIEKLPKIDEITFVDQIEFSIGGNAGNTAVALKKLGLEPLLTSRLGDDLQGDLILNKLSSLELNAENLKTLKKIESQRTAITISAVRENGDRSFIHKPGASRTSRVEDVTDDTLVKAKHLHFSGLSLLPQINAKSAKSLLQKAKRFDLETSYDTVFSQDNDWKGRILQLLPVVDYLFLNKPEARKLTQVDEVENMVAVLQDEGAENVIVKLGEEGSFVSTKDMSFHIPGFSVEAVDTTGAGDAFCAGFIAGKTKGWGVEKTTRLANWLGAQSTKSFGTETGVEDWEENF